MLVRLADPDRDAERAAEIYRPSVEEGFVSFEEVAPDAAEFGRRISATMARTPWLVAESDGRAVGFAYASEHRARAAYRWSVDISAYVDEEWRGRGIGTLLYRHLLALLKRQRFINVYAGITLPNPASIALHTALGMRSVGVYDRVGYKLGDWRDVAWYGMRLREPVGDPAEPIPLPMLRDADA